VTEVDIRALSPGDALAAELLLDAELGGRHQARLGEVLDVLALDGYAAWDGDRLVGIATCAHGGDRAELAALAVTADRQRGGIGGRLVEVVASAARRRGAGELWLVTTNDNLEALRLYQRHGFQLSALHAGAVDRARIIKPAIPLLGRHGIPIHDELILARPLTGPSGPTSTQLSP